jgi:hypothetical protein
VSAPPPSQNPAPARVLIAGGGVAGLETLLALRALAGDRVYITLLAPELKFVNRSMAVDQPFKVQRGRGIRLENTAAKLGARKDEHAIPVETALDPAAPDAQGSFGELVDIPLR